MQPEGANAAHGHFCSVPAALIQAGNQPSGAGMTFDTRPPPQWQLPSGTMIPFPFSHSNPPGRSLL